MTKQQKAAKTRAANAAARLWADVKAAVRREGCTCGLRKGMTHIELSKLGAGCTGNAWPAARAEGFAGTYAEHWQHYGPPRTVYVCPALALFRRRVDKPKAEV